jgi:hypothetical protein
MAIFGGEWTPTPRGFLYECESKGVVGKAFFQLIENTGLPPSRNEAFFDLACPAGLSVHGSKGSGGAAESGCAPLQ